MNFIFLLFLLLTAGCSTVPPTNVHQPMTARPSPRFDMPNGNGAIYQAANSRPLFEDRRARYVGDTITVKITESTTASTKSNNKLDKSNVATASVSGLTGLPGKGLLGLDLNAQSANAFSGKGEAANNNIFNGTGTTIAGNSWQRVVELTTDDPRKAGLRAGLDAYDPWKSGRLAAPVGLMVSRVRPALAHREAE